MANQKLTDRTTLGAAIADADLFHIVDVSNTSQDPAGSSFKVPASALKSYLAAWNLDGNTFAEGEFYIGTNSNSEFPIRTNAIERARFTNTAFILGVSSAMTASLVLKNSTNAFAITINSGVTSASYSLTLPTTQASGTQYLQNNGSGVLSWATISTGWALDGNTVGVEKWIGTVDNFAMPFRTNNTEWLRLNATGEFGVGVTASSGFKLDVKGTGLTTGTSSLRLRNSGSNVTFQVYNSGQFSAGLAADENIFFGASSGISNSTSINCTYFGYRAGAGQTSVGYNTAMGQRALETASSGFQNTAIGDFALNAQNSNNSTAVGHWSLKVANSDNNTAIGSRSGEGITSGSNNVLLGFYAGFRSTTQSNNLFIDNQDRSSYAGQQTNSLIYGTFSNDVLTQYLVLNGYIGINSGSAPNAALEITQRAVSGVSAKNALLVTGGAHLSITASTENIGGKFDFSATKQFATGALTTQREFAILAPTYAFTAASTITNAATFAISGAPTAGTNATITNSYALWVQGGISKFDGNVQLTQTVTTEAVTSDTTVTIIINGTTYKLLAKA